MDNKGSSDKSHKRSMRFTRSLLFALGLTAICWVILYVFLGHYSDVDKIAYEKMINGDGQAKFSETQVSKQNRTGLQKSIFIDLGGGRQELRMQSDHSELALEKTGRHVELVEHLHAMEGWIQESVYEVPISNEGFKNTSQVVKQQILLRVQAKEAIYHYKDGVFSAENFTFERYIFPGNSLDVDIQEGKLIAEGSAAVLKSSLATYGGEITAEELHVKSLQEGKEEVWIASADYASYNGEQLILEGHASVVYDKTTLSAHLIALTTKNTEKSNIQKIVADGNVKMKNYNGWNATADRAVFIRGYEPEVSKAKEFLPGTITLSMYVPEQLCHVTNLEGDDILASSIVINTIHENVAFIEPIGSLQNMKFSADRLVWNEATLKLILSGNVKIDNPAIGILRATNDVHFILSKIKDKKVLHGIETKDEAILTYFDPVTGIYHLLKSYGSFQVNHQKKEIKLLSPENSDGSIAKNKQIYFEDTKGIFYANRVFMKYQEIDKKIVPERIVLNGHVKIANFFKVSQKDKTTVNQYILADRVDFIPQTNQMIFKASKGRRVLFFDEENSLEVSAPGLRLLRDKAVRKDTIQGIGDVRFSFVESELEHIRHHFMLKGDK
jgi:lipopolysaccharide export system protein LptA